MLSEEMDSVVVLFVNESWLCFCCVEFVIWLC